MKQKGFTIVELLIVIVVIGILAAITIVAFNGIQSRANDTSVQSDLKNIGNLVEQYYAINGSYPSSIVGLNGAKVSKDAYGAHHNNGTGDYNLLYCRIMSGADAAYALIAGSKSGTVYHYTKSGVKPHGYALSGSSTTCPRAGVDHLLPGYQVIWGYNNSNWNPALL